MKLEARLRSLRALRDLAKEIDTGMVSHRENTSNNNPVMHILVDPTVDNTYPIAHGVYSLSRSRHFTEDAKRLEKLIGRHHDFAFLAYGHKFFTINHHKLLHLPFFVDYYGSCLEFSVSHKQQTTCSGALWIKILRSQLMRTQLVVSKRHTHSRTCSLLG